jgi:hypothetical protein
MSSLTGVSNHLLQGNNPVGSTIIQSKEGDDARSTDARKYFWLHTTVPFKFCQN